MTEMIADFFQDKTSVKQMPGIGVPQAMGTAPRDKFGIERSYMGRE